MTSQFLPSASPATVRGAGAEDPLARVNSAGHADGVDGLPHLLSVTAGDMDTIQAAESVSLGPH
jgi:hypothetical protein